MNLEVMLVNLDVPMLVRQTWHMTQAVPLPNRVENTTSDTIHYPEWGF